MCLRQRKEGKGKTNNFLACGRKAIWEGEEKRRGGREGGPLRSVVQGIEEEEEEEAVVRAGDDICSTLPSMKEKGKKKEEKRRKFVDHEKTLLLPFRAAIPPPLAVVSLPSS